MKIYFFEVVVFGDGGAPVGKQLIKAVAGTKEEAKLAAGDKFAKTLKEGQWYNYTGQEAEEEVEIALPPDTKIETLPSDAVATEPLLPQDGSPPPESGKKRFEYLFTVIYGKDNFDGHLPVSVEAEDEETAFDLACKQAEESCPKERKIWYKGKTLESYGYIATLPQEAGK